MQTAVTMIIVLKDYIAPHLDVNNQINWFHCYIGKCVCLTFVIVVLVGRYVYPN